MSRDPLRWVDSDEAPPRLRDLLRDAKEVPPMPDAVRDAVRATLPEPPAPLPQGATPAGVLAKATSGKGALAAAALSLGAASLVVLALVQTQGGGEREAPSLPTSAPPADADADRAAPATDAPLSPTDDPSAAPVDAAPAPPSPHERAPTRGAPSTRAGGDSLAEEHALVQRARADLARSPKDALAAAAEHERRFPDGQLAAERDYVRIKALLSLGRRDEAAAHGNRFVARFARSPYADRVRALIADGGAR